MTRGKRIYVLDTNVLMHDPTALFRFEEHDVFLPMTVLEELDAAKKGMFPVPLRKATIPHQVTGRFGAGVVMMKPATPGTGVIAGGTVRAVLEAAGIHDVLTKSLGSGNPHNVVKATVAGLQSLRQASEVAATRGKTVHELLGIRAKNGAGNDGAR